MGSDPGEHYFSGSPGVPSKRRRIRLSNRFIDAELTTDRGVFSPGAVDLGTRVLLGVAPDPVASGTLLDLGCGYGPIALSMAMASPAARVVAVDVNERARALCRTNADDLGVSNVTVLAPDEVDPTLTFDEIWSNPPVHIGKDALHDLLDEWLQRLSPGGHALLVVQRHLGADSLHRWLQDRSFSVTRLASKKGYRVFDVRASEG